MDIHTDLNDEFACIGNACRRNCCQGWSISLDSETTAYYNSLEDDFGEFIKSHMEPTEGGGSKFSLKKGEKCPAQREDGLCDIYIKYGENRLSKTCTEFPRYNLEINGNNRFRYLSNECEEVLRNLYDREKNLEVIIEAADKKDIEKNADLLDFLQLIAWCVDYIQDESVPLWNALTTTIHIAIEASRAFLEGDEKKFSRVTEAIPTISETYYQAITGFPEDVLMEVAWRKVRLISVAYLDFLDLTDFKVFEDMFPVPEKYSTDSSERGEQVRKAYDVFSSTITASDMRFYRRFFANMLLPYAFDLLEDNPSDVFLYEFVPRVITTITVPSLWSDKDLKDRHEFFSKLAMLQRMSKRAYFSRLSEMIKEQMTCDLTEYAIMLASLLR